MKEDWETVATITPDELITSEKYNNMYKQNKWKNSNSSDAKIVGLVTQVKKLQAKLKEKPKGGGEPLPGTENKQNYEIVPEWHKTRSLGITIEAGKCGISVALM